MVRRTRRIIWSDEAEKDRFDILDYWKNRTKSIIYSKKLDQLLLEKLKLISQYPYTGRLTTTENVRTVIVRDCLIIYEITAEEIIVVGIWEGHQNPENFNY